MPKGVGGPGRGLLCRKPAAFVRGGRDNFKGSGCWEKGGRLVFLAFSWPPRVRVSHPLYCIIYLQATAVYKYVYVDTLFFVLYFLRVCMCTNNWTGES